MLLDDKTDIVTVFHNEDNHSLHLELIEQINMHEPNRVSIIAVDNRVNNRGFAAGCNLGAQYGTAPVIGFLNPDTEVYGPFVDSVHAAFMADDNLVITGCRFGKLDREINAWGCHDWVCGAAFFVRRDWWEQVGGFDTIYRWSWEETDMIRRAQEQKKNVKSIVLPLKHDSPVINSDTDSAYKNHWFEHGARVFNKRWN